MLNDLVMKHRSSLAEQAELRAQVNTSRQVLFLSGNLVRNNLNTDSGVSARVYKNGVYGFASVGEYNDESIERVIATAAENARFLDGKANHAAAALHAVPGGVFVPQKAGGDVPQKTLIDFSREIDCYIANKYPNLAGRLVYANGLDMEKYLVTGDGAISHSLVPRSIVAIQLTALDSDGAPVELYEPMGGYGFFTDVFTDPKQLYEEIDQIYENLMEKREGVYADAGTKQCILGPELAGILAHEAVGHTVEADMVLGGSVAAHYMNKEVASPLVTMVDFAHTALGKPVPIPVIVDDEGVIAEDAVLIEKGILRGYMHNRSSALKMNMKPQGNARAYLFSDEPLIRMRNTAILPGQDKQSDMISSIEDGYYLIKTGNGQADTTGEFMFGVNFGYEIKNGKLGKAIKDTTISGVAFEMLKTVDMISDDMVWLCSGMCGKKQPIPVGMGGPALRCRINIGGR